MRRRDSRAELPDVVEVIRARRDLRLRRGDPVELATAFDVVARIREAAPEDLAAMSDSWRRSAVVLLELAAEAATGGDHA